MPIKFIHTGDIHFGMENYGKIDPATGLHQRFQDFIHCFDKIIESAIKYEVDFLLICGDVYHTPNPTQTQQRELVRRIMKLLSHNIQIVIITGNHDHPVSFGKASSIDIFSELNLTQIKIVSRPELFTLDFGEKGTLQVFGFPWPSKSRLIDKDDYRNLNPMELDDKLQYICTTIIEENIKSLSHGPAIFAGHLAMAEAQYSGSERTTLLGKDPVILTSTLARKEFKYVALGHIHKHQNLNKNASPPVIYSGSIERIDFNEENDDKGFYLVEIGDELNYRFIKTPARPMITIEADVRAKLDPTSEILEEINKHNVENAIVRIIYHTSYNFSETVRINDIRDFLASAFFLHGIIRKTEDKVLTSRAVITEDLTCQEALDKYIEQENLEKYKDDIKLYAEMLEKEL